VKAAALLLCCALTGCTPLVRYTDELIDPATGRTWVVRGPATFFGVLGFAAGVPIDLVVFPVSWVVYQSQPAERRDPQSTFLFPSIVLWKAGVLLSAPLDLLEFAAWRSWQPADALSAEELERREKALDDQAMRGMPVQTIYGDPPAPRRPGGGRSGS
jgi:hypothetical protein